MAVAGQRTTWLVLSAFVLLVMTAAVAAAVVKPALPAALSPTPSTVPSGLPPTSTPPEPPTTASAPATSGSGAQTACQRQPESLTGFHILSWTFATTQNGWALGLTTPNVAGCAVLAHTVDGGHSWRQARNVPALASAQPCPTCLSGVRFVTSAVGYAFGGVFFVTTDGGASWTQESAPPIALLEASAGTVVRVVDPCGEEDQCDEMIQESMAGSSFWRTLNTPSDRWSQVVLVGRSTLYLLSPTDGLWRSTDGGGAWTNLSNPCALLPTHDPAFRPQGQPGGITQVAATGTSVAVICISGQIGPQSAGYQQDVAVSQDEGATFGPAHPVPRLPGSDGSSGIDAIALPTPSTVVVVGDEGGVQTSFDGGVAWTTTVAQLSTFSFWSPQPIGFETPLVGHVAFPGDTVLTTGDGGRTWSAATFS